jgi:hypothetical protein
MVSQEFWIHGNTLTVETPQNLASISHTGFATKLQFLPGQSSWCHIAIPTPVRIDGHNLHVRNLYLLYNINRGEGVITTAVVYDGPKLVKRIEGLSNAGDHSWAIDFKNTIDLLGHHPVSFGMSISFLFQAAIDRPDLQPVIYITAAGAVFNNF